MLGGGIWENYTSLRPLVKKLKAIAYRHDEITFFLCPSRRSRDLYTSLLWRMGGTTLHDIFYKAAGFITGRPRKMHVMGTSYEDIKEGAYNPYQGLLAKADHIVVVGDSCSLVSEALFTGKNIYRYGDDAYEKLTKEGYIVPAEKLSSGKKFPTKALPSIDISREVAKEIVKEFKEHQEDLRKSQRILPGPSQEELPHLSFGTQPPAAAPVPEV